MTQRNTLFSTAKLLHDAETYREKGGVWSSDPTHVATHQATVVTPSTDSVATFANEIKKTFSRMDPIPDEDWPPSIGRHESNLVMIEHGRDTLPGAEEAEEMQRHYVGGKVDSIAERKKEIRYEDIFDFEATVDKSKKVPYDSKHFRMLIDGAPGVGKTTLCRKFCKDWGAGQILKQFSIVWLLNLREERIAKAKSLDDLFQHYNKKLLKKLLEHIEETGGEGNLLVCDGFDELSKKERTQHSLFLDIIRGKVLPKCSVIVSSRPYASQMLQQMKSITHHVEIVGFTEKQIKECIRQNITDKPKAEELIQQLKQRLDILSLCYTPLNAAIALYVYKQEKHTLPTTLTQLYTLYILHSLKRSVKIHFENLDADDITDLKNLPDSIALPFIALCKMAYNGLQDDQLGFSTSQLPQSLQGCPGCKGTKPDLLGLMSGSKSFTGSNAEVSYQFIHLTAQEFLAAWYAAIALSAEEQSKLFMEKTGDDRFRMMLLFLAGITGLQDTQVYQQIIHHSQPQLQEEQEHEQKLQQQQQRLQQLVERQQQLQLMELQPKQRMEHQLELKQEREQTSQRIKQIKVKLKYNFFFLLHLIYESQNVSLSPILASTVQRDGKLKLHFGSYDLFQCTVVAYFLSTCNFPWKHLELASVTDEKMEVIHQVCCEHAGSSDVRGAQNTYAANPPPFLKDTQELSLRYVYYGSTPPPKPTSFSYLLNMKLMSLSVTFVNVAMCTKYCSILFNVLTQHTTLQRLEIIINKNECAFDVKECEEILKTNTSLQYLKIGDIVRNGILNDLTAEHIAAGLVHNHSLKKLDISGNNITSVGATSIFRALVSNTTLESLNTSKNNLQSTPNSLSLPTSSSNTASLSPPSQQPTPALSTSSSNTFSLSQLAYSIFSSITSFLSQPTPALSTAHRQRSLPSPTPHDGGIDAAMAYMLSNNSTLTKLNVSLCDLTPQSCVSMFKAVKYNSSLKKLDISETTFDQAASEALADMLSCNQSLTKLNISRCGCQPKALARGLLHNTTLTKVTVWDRKDKRSIMAALVGLRREEGHTLQPDPEVARCKQILRYVCMYTVCTVYWEIFVTKKK